MIALEIIKRINRDFESTSDKDEVIAFLNSLYAKTLNVGSDQLARAIVYLLQGDIEQIGKFLKMNDDPRDIVMKAEQKAGNPGHYFLEPFTN